MTTTFQNFIQDLMSPVGLGSIVRIWQNHGPKGLDYAVVGLEDNKVHLVKVNCINQDGTLRKNTTKVHKVVPYSKVRKSSNVTISGLTSIMGTLKTLDPSEIQSRLNLSKSSKNFSKFKMYSPVDIDRRTSSIY